MMPSLWPVPHAYPLPGILNDQLIRAEMLFRRRRGRAPRARRETLAMPAWSAGSLNSASRGRRLMGKPIPESNLSLRAPAQRGFVMVGSLVAGLDFRVA